MVQYHCSHPPSVQQVFIPEPTVHYLTSTKRHTNIEPGVTLNGSRASYFYQELAKNKSEIKCWTHIHQVDRNTSSFGC